MAFFPLANTKKANGYCTLHNYSPNNWEPITKSEKEVWAIYSDGEKWRTKYLDKINAGESKLINMIMFTKEILKILRH